MGCRFSYSVSTYNPCPSTTRQYGPPSWIINTTLVPAETPSIRASRAFCPSIVVGLGLPQLMGELIGWRLNQISSWHYRRVTQNHGFRPGKGSALHYWFAKGGLERRSNWMRFTEVINRAKSRRSSLSTHRLTIGGYCCSAVSSAP